MLRFRLGPIPVQVQASHFLVSAFLAYSFARGGAGAAGWPAHPMALLGVWMAIIFVSVLVHELGHALVSLAFGYAPSIELVALGGLTTPNAPGPIPWHRDVLLTFAGPLFGLVLGVACKVAGLLWPEAPLTVGYVLNACFWANLGWAVMNLLPVPPLDGGRIANALLMRVLGKPGFLAAQVLALAVGAGVLLLALRTGSVMLGVLFAMFAFRSFSLIGAYLRGEAPEASPGPGALAFGQAAALFQAGELAKAKQLALGVLDDAEVAGPVRARAHHLLGWVALKEGAGRAALDHFSQVQGGGVEPQALAAAFSLVGDDGRALPLWELAYRETRDSTLLHEWAGTLLRLGRVDEVRRLNGVDWVAAYRCAERVSFLRGDYIAAAEASEAALERSARADLAYSAACARAQAGHPERALAHLERAAQLGFQDAGHAAKDPDLAPLTELPEFQTWLDRVRQSAPA